MTQPTTAAGRRLLTNRLYLRGMEFAQAIVAVEREAADQVTDAAIRVLQEKVRKMEALAGPIDNATTSAKLDVAE